MSKDVFRRCGCRDEAGKQLGAACPRLTTDPKHGSWSYSTSAGNNARTGRRQQLRKSGFTTKREAQNALAAARTQAASGRLPSDTKLTLGEFLTTWLERKKVDGLRESTLVMYNAFVNDVISPALGKTKLVDLHRHQVDTFVRGLPTATRGPASVRRIHATLSSAMTTAVKLGLLEVNPASNVQLPQVPKFRAASWEPEEAALFLKAVEDLHLAPLFNMAVHTGLRRGELCGLRWEDVSFSDRELIVRVQLNQVRGKVFEGPIKTNSGQDRRVSLDEGLIDTLSAWKLKQDGLREAWGSTYVESGRVFTYENGRELRPELASRTFTRVIEQEELTPIRFHDLRHLHASLLIAAGVPLAVVSKRLGHSTISVTVDLYGHLLRDANREAANAAAAMLLPREATAHTLPTQP